jgi:hypothetical protein
LLIASQNEVTIDDHPYRKSWPYGQRRLDIEVASDNLLSRLVERIATSTTQRLNDAILIVCIAA